MPAVGNDHGNGGLPILAPLRLDGFDHFDAFRDGPEHDVLPVEPGRGHRAQEELRAVRVGPGVRHGQDPRARVRQVEILVRKLGTVDGLAPRSVSAREVTALAHAGWMQ